MQGYVYFRNAKTLSAARAVLPGCHLVKANGTFAANKIYCSKDGDFTERGNPPKDDSDRGDDERARYAKAWDAAKIGEMEEIDADIRIRCYTALCKIARDYMAPKEPIGDVCGIWIWGESGSGKTRFSLAKWPEAYPKPRNQWWDGYQEEKVVICDDVDKFDVKLGGKFKHWADFAPFIAEIKGSSRKIRPEQFVVTSQYRIEDIWEDRETRDALNRRFKTYEKLLGVDLIL